MSEVFAKPHQRAQKVPNAETIPKLLEENDHLLSTIAENFNKGRIQDALILQKQLHRNLVYLGCLAYPEKSTDDTDQATIQNPQPNESTHNQNSSTQLMSDQQQQQQLQQQQDQPAQVINMNTYF